MGDVPPLTCLLRYPRASSRRLRGKFGSSFGIRKVVPLKLLQLFRPFKSAETRR
jgi:hypothetical protein